MKEKRSEGGGQVGKGEELTAIVVAGRKNIVTAAIPFMTSLWVSMTRESCWVTILKLYSSSPPLSYIAHVTRFPTKGKKG